MDKYVNVGKEMFSKSSPKKAIKMSGLGVMFFYIKGGQIHAKGQIYTTEEV